MSNMQKTAERPIQMHNHRFQDTTQQIYDNFAHKKNHQIHLHKVAAHKGVRFNEIADVGAKIASGVLNNTTDCPGFQIEEIHTSPAGKTPGGWSIQHIPLCKKREYPNDPIFEPNERDPERCIPSLNIRLTLKHFHRLFATWHEADTDKWAAKYGRKPHQLCPNAATHGHKSMAPYFYSTVAKTRYNRWPCNNSPQFRKLLPLHGMTTKCPICNEDNTIDSWYHRENCSEKEARQARTAKHDEVTAWGCRSIKLGKHGNSKIFADLPGLRVSDERTLRQQMVDWTDEVTIENDTSANTNDIEIDEESSEDEEEINKKCTGFNAPYIDPKWTQKYETGIESDTEELESIHPSEEGSDTDNEDGSQPKHPPPLNPRDDKLIPYSFEHERDSENEDEIDHDIEADRTRWHYKRIGAIRHFQAGALDITSAEGEYELLAVLIDPESQAIFAHYRIHGKDTSETQQNNFTVPWRHARRTASRTIPAAIDPDADLNPDIVTLVGLPDGQRIPKKPTKKITIQLADTAIIREGKTGEAESIEQTARRKIRKYQPVLKRLKKMGWSVDPKLRLIDNGRN